MPDCARSDVGPRNVFRRPSRLFFVFALFVFLVLVFFAFPWQRACGPGCVVLIGDSITSKWQGLAQTKQFSGLKIINRGLPGDSTAHMLSRFNHDVVQLRPRVVVILGGINDIAQIPLPAIEQNLASMAETAERHGIRVVLATLPPTGSREGSPVGPPGGAPRGPTGEYATDQPFSAQIPGHDEIVSGRDKIETLNNWVRNFANQKHYSLVDYHSALADERGCYSKGLSTDGVHPSIQGYERMAPLLSEAIRSAIRDGR